MIRGDRGRFRTSFDREKRGKRSLFDGIDVQEGYIRKTSHRTLKSVEREGGSEGKLAKSKNRYRNT